LQAYLLDGSGEYVGRKRINAERDVLSGTHRAHVRFVGHGYYAVATRSLESLGG